MRIIAGEFRGRKLLPPASDSTRPITDRAKQSLFDVLDSAGKIEGGIVFDCFAGTGSMGLECLSRGASHATFFEADHSAVALLRRNIQTLVVQARSTVIAQDLFAHFRTQIPASNVNLVFLDPPYRFLRERPGDLKDLAQRLARLLSPDGLVIFRHDVADVLALAPLRQVDQRQYGSMVIELLGPSPA